MSLGVLELSDRPGGYLRRRETAYQPGSEDIKVPDQIIKRFQLRTGDEIDGKAGRSGGRGSALESITTINDRPPAALADRPQFSRLTAIHPNEMLKLESPLTRQGQPDQTTRVIDLLCPLGKGQRALIVAPAKAGKTMVLEAIARGVATNYPDASLFILLVDERPEEVFEMEQIGVGEVVASSFDFPPARHVAAAELLLERACRRVELGQDVVLIVDSITRLARAYNSSEKGTGRTLSGGLDTQALEKPKRFLGGARKIEPSQGGGSLTIIATALIDTGSKMDQVIYEEFKGTGNSEIMLSRELADRRIYPAIDIVASGTRREELLLSPEGLGAAQKLRQRFAGFTPLTAMEDLLVRLRRDKTNADLIRTLA